jgi:hypothetical protein
MPEELAGTMDGLTSNTRQDNLAPIAIGPEWTGHRSEY